METILTVVDLEQGTRDVIDATCKYARLLNASVILVNVEPLLPGAEGAGAEDVVSDLENGYREEIQTIHDLGEELSALGLANRVLIIEGTAADELVKEVAREEVSLIVIGSEPHGALVEAMTHGLREQLAKRVRCPILLVPLA